MLALPGGVVWAYDGTEILRSTDEGAHWRAVLPTWPQKPTALQVTGAFFLTARDAWAVTDNQWPAPPGVTTVWQTTNGGATWHEGISFPGLAMTDYGSPIQELVFADALHGYALDHTGFLWATSDGGVQRERHQSARALLHRVPGGAAYGLGFSGLHGSTYTTPPSTPPGSTKSSSYFHTHPTVAEARRVLQP
ncbi:MAG TPA: hypothetical protein VME20_00895 [Acidimicrobiales bacterium]|nr:hypothetical protein [Acidimicrobiales bacterium]